MIKEFRGEYKWLSNFELVDIEYNGIVYPSTEHAYMSAKNDSITWKNFCCHKGSSCSDVKKAGRDITLREDWEDVKLHVMNEVCRTKFFKEPYRTKLLATGNQNLVEGNTWGDKFWGVDIRHTPNEGENHLGRIIMDIRTLLQGGLS